MSSIQNKPPLNPPSRCFAFKEEAARGALLITFVAGAILLGIGLLKLRGVGAMATCTTGSLCMILSTALFLSLTYSSKKNNIPHPQKPSPKEEEREKPKVQANNLSFGLSSSDSKEFTQRILGISAEVNGQRPFARLKSARGASKLPEGEGVKLKTQVNKKIEETQKKLKRTKKAIVAKTPLPSESLKKITTNPKLNKINKNEKIDLICKAIVKTIKKEKRGRVSLPKNLMLDRVSIINHLFDICGEKGTSKDECLVLVATQLSEACQRLQEKGLIKSFEFASYLGEEKLYLLLTST